MSFVVYVETNWLVACVLPHDTWGKSARDLLAKAERGDCELRIPEICFLEARHVIEERVKEHARTVKDICKLFDNVAENLNRDDARTLAQAVSKLEASYRPANPMEDLRLLIDRCKRSRIHRPNEEQSARDDLRNSVIVRGTEIVDLHILAAIVADRDADPRPKAAVLSTNKHHFRDSGDGAKLPPGFYSARKMVYRENFDLQAASNIWDKSHTGGWYVSKQADPRRAQAQSLIQKLPDDRLDAALTCLRSVQGGA